MPGIQNSGDLPSHEFRHFAFKLNKSNIGFRIKSYTVVWSMVAFPHMAITTFTVTPEATDKYNQRQDTSFFLSPTYKG